jgi:CheY-specific phosphatase CheX
MTERIMHADSLKKLNAKSLEPVLLEVVSDVLEQFSFMFTEPSEGNLFNCFGPHLLQAQIVFKGSVCGGLSMFAMAPFCVQLAANVLGMEPEDVSYDHAYDALKEVVNVVCGEFLLRVGGKKQVFDLSIPKIRKMPVANVREIMTLPGVVQVMIDEQPVLVQVEIDSFL